MARKPNSYFQFKQFRIEQGQCAMKVTLDACFFGALVEVSDSQRILDIGAGTGLLSLMAAQRSSARIDAIELDREAAGQAKENVTQSPWTDQIKVIQSSIQTFSGLPEGYDTIICNPPFFENALKAPDRQRNMARHTCSLSFDELAQSLDRHLARSGSAWVLLPTRSTPSFLNAVANCPDLKHSRTIAIRSKPNRQEHRHILTITKNLADQSLEEKSEVMTVHTEAGGYSDRMKVLLGSYYIHPLE
ncbi:hypothetical protein GZ77_16430 [Endozoicomonas montiporae]|uniref:tRNA1(Val) (adenine(37)-N6)-methyltransferase n=2 Tax=Endozoicomonas montiporae TaxID=1027273 RepID=A0A081N5X8_9GAMM|nr:methyltransferase [Endozoicomonas montiporae]AMO57242.1 tRNA1Val (adenine37-N6)-methyltransferase [Endozoicomonas montiporae CL-33]KEQ13851.1 hypothetical protein GZ77_16430 [Endozoicomonas montiporae]